MDRRVFVIAEAGVNHNGSESEALALVDSAALAGADAVKFQTFRAEDVVARGTPTAGYQAENTGEVDQFRLLKKLELSNGTYERIRARCEQKGIEFMSTPFDTESAKFLVGLGMQRIKVPSGEITNFPLIRALCTLGKPLIISTGMSSLEEVGDCVEWVRKHEVSDSGKDRITLLHCTSNYPAAPVDMNLLAMRTMSDRFGLPVGYSDHTLGLEASIAAVALGAVVIEKHFTLDKSSRGPDHLASLDTKELANLVQSIRNVSVGLGDGIKQPRSSEMETRDLVRRSVAAQIDLKEGDRLRLESLTLLRPGVGIPPVDLDKLIGARVRRPVQAGVLLRWEDVD